MNAEDIALYMRLSGDQMRYWICVSLDRRCAGCEGVKTELVGADQFAIYLCCNCLVPLPRYMVFRDQLSPEAYNNIERYLRQVVPRPCEECSRIESAWCMFSLGPGDGKRNFICGQCAHRWANEGGGCALCDYGDDV